jgi:geranylgeranyl diphosphate synthase, type II
MNVVTIVCAVVIIAIVIITWCIARRRDTHHTGFSEAIIMQLPNIKKYQQRIEKYIDEDLNESTSKYPGLHRMCVYAISGGKKIRSVIMLSIADRSDRADAISSAVALEYLHDASLILDDIHDKDDYRRGRKSVHKIFGISKAQMCALYLIGRAGKLMQFANAKRSNELTIFIYDILFEKLRGLIEGQYIDVSNEFANNSNEQIMHKKTGTMFEISFILGWTLAVSRVPTEEELHDLQLCAELFGQIFQIADDFEDIVKDARTGAKFNYVLNHGKARAFEYLGTCVDKFRARATALNIYTNEISESIAYLYKKSEGIA